MIGNIQRRCAHCIHSLSVAQKKDTSTFLEKVFFPCLRSLTTTYRHVFIHPSNLEFPKYQSHSIFRNQKQTPCRPNTDLKQRILILPEESLSSMSSNANEAQECPWPQSSTLPALFLGASSLWEWSVVSV